MKRQVQYEGVKKWAGSDIVECQSQPLEAIDRFFGQYGPHILQGCEVTTSGDRADISAGLVALEGKDADGNDVCMVVPFEGVTGTVLPVYLTLSHTVRERPYVDGSVKPVAYDYKAVASAVEPDDGSPYLEITAAGGRRFSDAVQDAGHRFITDAERTKWNKAQSAAENHADSVAAEAEETAVRDAVLRTRLTGAVMGKGLFKSSDPALTAEIAGQPHTTVILFVTPTTASSGNLSLYNEGAGGNIGYGCHIFHTGSNVIVSMRGLQIAAKTVPLGALCCVAISYDGDRRCIAAINGTTTVKETPAYMYPHDPQQFLLGGNEAAADTGKLPGIRLVAARRFNFAMTSEDLTAIWNGGHPELWRVPDEWRRVRRLGWPTAIYKPEAETWARNTGNAVRTDNVVAANGFSGNFQRFEIPEGGTAISIYNAFQRYDGKTRRERQRIRFEYRSSGSISVRGLGNFPANTGNATVAEIIGDTADYMVIELKGQANDYMEIRTLAIDAVGCLLDLFPAGLTPTVWYDASGQENDVPYFLNGNKAGEVELSYDTTGFADTTDADREAVLAYANRYDVDREAVLVRMADANAEQALTDHAADTVKHITASERSTWNAKATLDETGHVVPQQIAPQQGRQQGVRTEYGYYNSTAASLNPEGSQTHVATFVTGADVTTDQCILGTTRAVFSISNGSMYSPMGSGTIPVKPNTLYQAVYSVDMDGNTASLYLNSIHIITTATFSAVPGLNIGKYSTSTIKTFKGTVISYRQFDFAMRVEDVAEVWNGGRPVAWRVPSDYRKELPSSWPTSVYTTSASTWRENHNYITYTPNVAAINGFSGAFERFTAAAQAEDLSTYNSFRQNYAPDKACWQYVKFEYRCDKNFEFRSGGTAVASFAANTGDAKVGYVLFPPKTYGGFYVGKGGTYLEIRTLEITTLGLCTAAFEPESLLPDNWRNLIGSGTGMEYTSYEEDTVAVFDYTVPEEPGAVLLAKQYTDEREEQIRLDFKESDKTILAQAKAYSDSVTDSKQDTIPTITIANFDTFNPSRVASMSGMLVGACCYFISNEAVGRPATITDNKVWCGRITKMSATQYRIEAFNTSGSISTPQFATRLYTNTKAYDWQLLTEDMRNGTSGYAKLPGGLMLEWGKVAAADINVQPVTVKFPMTFPGGIPYSIACIAWDGDNELDMRTFTVTSLSASQMQVRITEMSGGSVGANGCTFLWQAIGKW